MYKARKFPLYHAADLCGPDILDRDSSHDQMLDTHKKSWPPLHLVTQLVYPDATRDLLRLHISWPHHCASVAAVKRTLGSRLCGIQLT